MARPQVVLIAGAGFSKAWGLPLASEVMDLDDVRNRHLPGRWQRELIDRVEVVWNATRSVHKGIVDAFAGILWEFGSLQLVVKEDIEKTTVLKRRNGQPQVLKVESGELRTPCELTFEEFASFLALRLSLPHWRVGGAHETKWGTGDHVRMQRSIPGPYKELIKALKNVNLIAIVTTNYDLVIEKLVGPRETKWRLGGFNYGDTGGELVGRHQLSARWSYGPVPITGKTPLLKLNGSLNWAISPEGKLVRYVDARPSRGRRYKPLILPPAGQTDYDTLRPTWECAGSALRKADTWMICGYSIPGYDEAIRGLLTSSAVNLRRVVISDVAPTPVEEKLYELLRDLTSTVDIRLGPGITPELKARELVSLLLS
jgi:hypothetical protein